MGGRPHSDSYRSVSAANPGEQGLKHGVIAVHWATSSVSAANPGEQGLKHGVIAVHWATSSVSAANPGEQGLKQYHEDQAQDDGRGGLSG